MRMVQPVWFVDVLTTSRVLGRPQIEPKLKLNSEALVHERTIPTERPPLVDFADRGCHVVSVTDPYGRIIGFLDRNRQFSSK
jgi:hypothetical protein